MNSVSAFCACGLRRSILFAIVFATVSVSASSADDVVRVEEDWELVLDTPSGVANSPQLETVMSPFPTAQPVFGRITWNYRESPYYASGGLEMQAWNGESLVLQKRFNGSSLSTVGETISWTQRMEADGCRLSWRIQNGQSTTWGAFGGYYMEIDGQTIIPTLNGYSSETSVQHALITYGVNRVIRLQITRVRLYGEDDVLVSTDNTPKVIYER